MENLLDSVDNRLVDLNVQMTLDSLNEGVYVCDPDRRIVYWSKSATRITGWKPEEVVGLQCFDNVLCHADKNGHRFCQSEHCPLHQSMINNVAKKDPVLLYAMGKDKRRIPMLVSVAPVHDSDGEVIGGIETFREASDLVKNMERARAIQEIATHHALPTNKRVKFTTYDIPCDIVGSAHYAIKPLNRNRYGVMLADVMGNGITAALHTLHLSSLCDQYYGLLASPKDFTTKLNNELAEAIEADISFATAICGLVDLRRKTFRFTSAGAQPVLWTHADGTYEFVNESEMPLAMVKNTEYTDIDIKFQKGDRLLLSNDGAVEVRNPDGKMLGSNGLLELLEKQDYPATDFQVDVLEKHLLEYSNSIQLENDLAFLEIQF